MRLCAISLGSSFLKKRAASAAAAASYKEPLLEFSLGLLEEEAHKESELLTGLLASVKRRLRKMLFFFFLRMSPKRLHEIDGMESV